MTLRWIFSAVMAVAAAFALMVMLVAFPQPSTALCCEDTPVPSRAEGVRLAGPK